MMSGVLGGVIAKLTGLGTAAKAAIAAVTAVLTMVVAGGATGVLPVPGSHDVGSAVESALQQTSTAGVTASTSATVTPAGGTNVNASAGSTTTSSSTSSTTASTVHASTTSPTVTTPTTVAPTLPTALNGSLPGLSQLPVCVQNLIPAKGTTPDPATLIPQVVACVQSLISSHLPTGDIQSLFGSLGLPGNLSTCLSSIFSALPTLATGNTSTFTHVMATCVPTGSLSGIGSIPGIASMPGIGSIPGIGSLPTTGSFQNKGGTATHSFSR